MFKPGQNSSRYAMSFTSGALLYKESILMAEVYLTHNSWEAVRLHAIETNILQTRSSSSLKRLTHEVISRLKHLSAAELVSLTTLSTQDQKNLLWIAICRRYRFIADFALEVLHERYVTLKQDLSPEHFDIFYNRKAEWHPELDHIAATTRQKLRQVVFKMMQQADLINAHHQIIPAYLSTALTQRIINRNELMWFPVFEVEI